MGLQLRGEGYEHDTMVKQTHWLYIFPLTQVSTEGLISSSSWYSTTVGPGWREGVGSLSMSQSNDLRCPPYTVELLSSHP